MKPTANTLLEALVQHLRAQQSPADGQVAPVAILWTDPENCWRSLLPQLRAAMPELLVHGDYKPAECTGPSIWLRCVVDRSLPEVTLPAGAVPVIYLPGTSRQLLTTGDECPRELQPLVELLFRGTVWLQRGGHDWTVTAFLTSPQALGLDLAKDVATKTALLNALREVANLPLERLRRGRLEASDFEQLLSNDVVRDLLLWMGRPDERRVQVGAESWAAFCGQCEKRLGFEPEKHGVLKAGELMGRAEGAWQEVWARFEEAPSAFPGVAELLRRCPMTMFAESHWPKRNDKEEERVAAAFADLEGVPHAETCERVIELEKEHGRRRAWVWTRLGQSPLAMALESLAELATIAKRSLGGGSPDEMAQAYVQGAWRADAAVLRALRVVSVEHESLVREVVQQLAEPWLADTACAFQQAHDRSPMPVVRAAVEPDEGGCLLFVDGLRYDLARLLAERLDGKGCRTDVRHRWAALPTVTATGKAAVSPVAGELTGARLGKDFAPSFRSGRVADAAGLRAAASAKGYQVLGGDAGDWPLRADARGWFEFGDIDTLGHERQEQLPRLLDEEIERLVVRVGRLLDAGWRSVRVVTDHGWLYLPDGLPRAELPKHLTETRWARCAVIAGASQVDVPRVSWHWNAMESAATAPGIGCFNQEVCYAHGGLSLQECLIPDIAVSRGGSRVPQATVRAVTWRSMRCLIEADVAGGEVRADLRLESATGASVAKSVKVLEEDGSTSLVLADDRYETSQLVLVLLAPDHSILAQREVRAGESS